MGLSAFNNRDGVFGREVALSAAKKMPGYRWAQSSPGVHPDFQRGQVVLQSLYTAQSPTERNHKMEGIIKTKVRNRLKSETTNKLLYICANTRLSTRRLRRCCTPSRTWHGSRPNPIPRPQSR